jgi:transcriptional regulator with XRE-family HTH domain
VSNEGKHFSDRLRSALKEAGYSAYGPTELAHQFNKRFAGHPVSVHAARKWLMGEAIPTQDKVRVLAEWLTVPAEWLRFGGHDGLVNGGAPNRSIEPELGRLIADVQRLEPAQRRLVTEFVRLVIRLNQRSGE